MDLNGIKKLVISPTTPLKDAMRILEATRHKLVFVVSNEDKLRGSVTDGDIRRGIINGVKFDDSISDIMFKHPRFVRQGEENFEEKAKEYIVTEELQGIPILDESDRIVDILFLPDLMGKELPEQHKTAAAIANPVVIMAGGKGARLDPFTKILPKPLIPYGDKPIIEKIMDNFHKYGFNNFILTLNYRKELIKMYFKENQPSYNLEWVEEDQYLGTAGSLGLLKNNIKTTFFVCNCDILLEHDFRKILRWHKGEKALMTLIGCHKEVMFPYGTLEINAGKLDTINEKPKFDCIINTGVYVMEPEVLKFITPGKRLDMNDLIKEVIGHGKVTVYPICDGWFDLGQWKEYKESLYLLQNGKDED